MLQSIGSFLTNPTTATVLEVYIVLAVFSAFVQSLPPVEKINNVWYTFFVSFLSILASDFKTFSKSLPAPPITLPIVTTPSLTTTTTEVTPSYQPIVPLPITNITLPPTTNTMKSPRTVTIDP